MCRNIKRLKGYIFKYLYFLLEYFHFSSLSSAEVTRRIEMVLGQVQLSDILSYLWLCPSRENLQDKIFIRLYLLHFSTNTTLHQNKWYCKFHQMESFSPFSLPFPWMLNSFQLYANDLLLSDEMLIIISHHVSREER